MLEGSEEQRREVAMKGQVGDEIVIEGREIGDLRRTGEVLEVLETGGVTHYRVRWDDGTDCVFFPGSDARFVNTHARKH